MGDAKEALKKLGKLEEELLRDDNVLLAYVFGSSVHGFTTPLSDVDVAVILKDDSLERLGELWSKLARALGLSEDRVDLVDLNRASLHLKFNVLTKGVKLIERGRFEEDLIRELNEKYPEVRMLQELSLKEWLSSTDPSKIDPLIVKERLSEAKDEASLLKEEVLSRTVDEVKSTRTHRRLLERSVQVITEAILDVCRHIASVKGWGPAASYADFVKLMTEHNVITRELADELKGFVTWRNIIAHRYLEVDHKRLYEDSKRLGSAVNEFEKQVASYLRKSSTTNP